MKTILSKKLAAIFCVGLIMSCSASCMGRNDIELKKIDKGDSSSASDKDSDSKDSSDSDKDDSSNGSDKDSKSDNSSETEKNTGTATAHLVCAGDNLIHDNIYVEALEKGGGEKYDFTDCYKHIKKYIEGADVAILNQETLVNDAFEPSTYPTFSTPTEDGDAVIDIGFNVISMCNNHVLDKGEEGLISSLDYWDKKGILHYGAYRSHEDAEDIKTMEVNGITFAFLGYMEHTNGIFLDDSGAEVRYLSDTETIRRQIEEADKIADVVVVSCHYGTEILNELNQQQIDLTPQLVEWGADLIIGTQAHAISTCEYLDKPDGGKAFVYYGLGNFFSTMYEPKSLVGLIGDMDVVKNFETGEVTFENVKAIPVISHFEALYYDSYWYNCAVYPYKDYTDEMFAKNFVEGFSRDSVEQSLSYIPDEFLSIE